VKPSINFVIPFIQELRKVDIRIQTKYIPRRRFIGNSELDFVLTEREKIAENVKKKAYFRVRV
jgi:regulator of protease activity HflC (stomatin/prohibitin superfamily)